MRIDHLLHFLGAWAGADLLSLFMHEHFAMAAMLVAGAMKDVVWDGLLDRGEPDGVDFLAVGAGIALSAWDWSGETLILLILFWHGYIYCMGLYRAYLTGRLKGLSLALCAPVVAITFLLDFIAQVTVFSLAFLEWPREWLVTYRLRRHMAGPDSWRRRWADYICKHLLDPFDPTGAHCDGINTLPKA